MVVPNFLTEIACLPTVTFLITWPDKSKYRVPNKNVGFVFVCLVTSYYFQLFNRIILNLSSKRHLQQAYSSRLYEKGLLEASIIEKNIGSYSKVNHSKI